jgi:hypothetical protein
MIVYLKMIKSIELILKRLTHHLAWQNLHFHVVFEILLHEYLVLVPMQHDDDVHDDEHVP